MNFTVPNHFTREHIITNNLLETSNELQNYRKYEPLNYMFETYNKFCNKTPNTDVYVIEFYESIEIVKNKIIEIIKKSYRIANKF